MENSDEPYADEITEVLMNWRKHGKSPETTTELKEAIEEALTFLPEKEKKRRSRNHVRTFQALRIDVNQEFEVLYAFLDKLPQVMNPGGRIAILTFHSGEDRLVKRAFKEGKKAGIYSEICKDVIFVHQHRNAQEIHAQNAQNEMGNYLTKDVVKC